MRGGSIDLGVAAAGALVGERAGVADAGHDEAVGDLVEPLDSVTATRGGRPCPG